MNVQAYKNIIVPLLQEDFDERESENLFKITLEDYFQKRYLDVRSYNLNEIEIEELNYIFEKITNHYPIQYIFNKAHFYGFDFYVDESVLIPRPETEELVHWILTDNKQADLSLLDIGTGSGCIPIAIKKNKLKWQVQALDISLQALEIAQKNAHNLQASIEFINGDILNFDDNLVQQKWDIIVSNPPYIPYAEKLLMSTSTVLHEPDLALFVQNKNPILFYDAIADFAQKYLNKNGKLYFELNEFNAHDVYQLLEKKGFTSIELKKDLSERNRMIKAEFISS